ncbi:MAG: hypothetical protein ACSLE2_18100 [Lysobacterales bacterium]
MATSSGTWLASFIALCMAENIQLSWLPKTLARYLERQGLLVRDAGHSYLTAEGVDADRESPINHLLGSAGCIGPQTPSPFDPFSWDLRAP